MACVLQAVKTAPLTRGELEPRVMAFFVAHA